MTVCMEHIEEQGRLIMDVRVSTGKRSQTGRGSEHIIRPGVNKKGERRAWCGSPVAADIRNGVTILPNNVHSKCVEKMGAVVREGDAAILACKPTSPDYDATVTRAHVDAVRAELDRQRDKRHQLMQGAEQMEKVPEGDIAEDAAFSEREESIGIAFSDDEPEQARPVPDPVPNTPESLNAGIFSGKMNSPYPVVTLTQKEAVQVERERLRATRREREERTRKAPLPGTDNSVDAVVWKAFAEAITSYRLDPDRDVTHSQDSGTLHVVPKSETAFKRIQDKAQKITRKMRRAGVGYRVKVDHGVRAATLVKEED